MVKTYVSNCGQLSTTLTLKRQKQSVDVRIRFKTSGNDPFKSYYTTADKDEQAAIESHPSFGSKIRIWKSFDEPTKPTEAAATGVESAGKKMVFRTYQEAANYMHEQFGIDKSLLLKPDSILSAGTNHGIEIVIGA